MMSKPYSGRKKSAIQTSENRILFPVQSPIRSEGPYRRDYSHSIVAIVLCVLPCAISCHLVRLFSSSPNHFVIRWVITNHRIPDSNADFCDDSLAIIPDFVNGNSIGWFAVRRFGQNRHSYSSGDSLEVVYVPIRKLILGAGISSKKCQGQPRLLEALLL